MTQMTSANQIKFTDTFRFDASMLVHIHSLITLCLGIESYSSRMMQQIYDCIAQS